MVSFRALRPTAPPEYSLADVTSVCITAAVVFAWIWVCGGAFSFLALLGCQIVFLAFYMVGTLVSAWRPIAGGVVFDLPLRLLVGYALFNTAFFILAWLSPLGILVDFGILFAVALGVFVWMRPVRRSAKDPLASLWVLGIALAAASLWCQDSIRPIAVHGDGVLFKPWLDTFYHAVHIRMFGASYGASTIEDFRLAGIPARLYHYAPYLTPAFIKQLSGITAYTACTAILVPVGIFFTGLGAYVLVASFWGRWPGLFACAALLLLPDGAQQWIGNPFLSYHWLIQISPGATFGLALLAVAWLYVLLGCLRGSVMQVATGWFFGGLVVFYKAQFFVASALLLLVVPIIFLRRLRPYRHRAWAVLGAIVVYVVAIAFTQKTPGLPLIRFDGSSTGRMMNLMNSFTKPGAFKTFVADWIGSAHGWIPNVGLGAPYLLVMALGVFVPVGVFLWLRYRTSFQRLLMLFPVLIVGNFLLMALGLAFDGRGVGLAEELPHRPFVLMYFVVMAWMGGVIGSRLVRSCRGRVPAWPVMAYATILLLAVPAYFGSGVQRLWAIPTGSHVRFATGFYHAAEYMRVHGKARDIVQDSSFDSHYVMAGLTELRPYVEHMLVYLSQNAHLVDERTNIIDDFMKLGDANAVIATAKKLGIRWFLLYPGHVVRWPASIVNTPVFEHGGFRVYRFE